MNDSLSNVRHYCEEQIQKITNYLEKDTCTESRLSMEGERSAFTRIIHLIDKQNSAHAVGD